MLAGAVGECSVPVPFDGAELCRSWTGQRDHRRSARFGVRKDLSDDPAGVAHQLRIRLIRYIVDRHDDWHLAHPAVEEEHPDALPLPVLRADELGDAGENLSVAIQRPGDYLAARGWGLGVRVGIHERSVAPTTDILSRCDYRMCALLANQHIVAPPGRAEPRSSRPRHM